MSRTEIVALTVIVAIGIAIFFPSAGGPLLRFLGAMLKVIAEAR